MHVAVQLIVGFFALASIVLQGLVAKWNSRDHGDTAGTLKELKEDVRFVRTDVRHLRTDVRGLDERLTALEHPHESVRSSLRAVEGGPR